MSRRPFLWICLIIGLAIVLGVYCHKKHAPVTQSEESQSSSRISNRSVAASAAARKHLEDVVSGKRKAPDYENREASTRYYALTNRWVSELNLADCIALIEQMESAKKDHSMVGKLFNRYGELDPPGAIARLKGSSSLSKDSYSDLLSNVLRGWGRKNPVEAWDYFLKLDQEELSKDDCYRSVVFEVFRAWVAKDAMTAYKQLLELDRDYFHAASGGYYTGMPQDADFAKEAAQFELTLKQRRHSSGNSLTIFGVEWHEQYILAAAFASIWALNDTEAATAWWLRVLPGSDEAKIDSDWIADRLGFFVARWSGLYEADQPKQAIEWTENHFELLQNEHFQNIAIPFIADNTPEEALEIIQKIQSVDRQTQLLEELVRSPDHLMLGYKSGALNIAARMHPDNLEPALDRFALTDGQRARVTKAIQERRDYEAKQPPPPPSDW